tara:strand:- start:885 stop:1700 length:816 start_codon:yes stop_codon:yes gene_type:complete
MIRHRGKTKKAAIIQGGRKGRIKKISHPALQEVRNEVHSQNRTFLKKQRPAVIKSKRGSDEPVFDWNKVNFSKVEPIWKGETAFIIGGGPSLEKFDFKQLKYKKTIAINKAVQFYPEADILYWTDSRVYSWYKKEIDNFKGDKYTIKPFHVPKDVKALRNTGKTGLEYDPTGLRHGNNSGYAAINLAFHLGVKRIILLGFDMGNTGGKSHFHEGYPVKKTQDKTYEMTMAPCFLSLVEPLKRKKVEVINANPNSKLNCFPKLPIGKCLHFS